MLSGKVPFQSSHRDRTAESIMNRIKGGEFSMKSKEWDSVSEPAKRLIRGLLTVDHTLRLTMTDLSTSDWLNGVNSEVFAVNFFLFLIFEDKEGKRAVVKKSRNRVINWPNMSRSRFICRFVFDVPTFTDVLENRD